MSEFGAGRVGLHRALLGVEQAVADREDPDLVELDRLVGHQVGASPRRCRRRAACSRRAAPSAAARDALELALDERAVEVEEGQRLQRAGERVARTAAQRGLRDRPPAEAGDDVVDLARGCRPGPARTFGRDDPADADRERLLEHDDPPGAGQRGPHLVQRERAEAT